MVRKGQAFWEWFAKKVPFKTYRENWQKRMKAAGLSLRSVSKRLPWSKVLTRKGVLYLSALLMAIVTVAGAIYLAYGPGAGNDIGRGDETPGLETLSGEIPGRSEMDPASEGPPLSDGGAVVSADPVAGNESGPDRDLEPAVAEAVSHPIVPVPAEGVSPLPGIPINPVVARVSSAFGWRQHPIFGDWRHHPGVDLAAPLGTPVQAVLGGTVADIYQDHVLGQVIILNHGPGWETRYGHCQDVSVETGSYLVQGEVMAVVGETGLFNEPHLHFEIRCNGQAVDPQEYLPAPSPPAEGEHEAEE